MGGTFVTIELAPDAADVAVTTTFGPTWLQSFKVWTDEIASINHCESSIGIRTDDYAPAVRAA